MHEEIFHNPQPAKEKLKNFHTEKAAANSRKGRRRNRTTIERLIRKRGKGKNQKKLQMAGRDRHLPRSVGNWKKKIDEKGTRDPATSKYEKK